jgi:hypothetical protein
MSVVVPDIAELFEEAYERAGLEMRSGYDMRTARRSLNLLALEWQNRGLNLFTIVSGTVPLVAGQAEYTMPDDTIDLIEHQLRTGTGTNQTDIALERISVSTYAAQTNKALQGRPTQIYITRGASSVTATLWPVPDAAQSYTLFFYRLRGIDGVSSGAGGSAAIPPRFVPALVAGLAYEIASKRPEVADRALPLKQIYEEQFQRAADEDRDKSSTFFAPFYPGGF